MWCNLWLPKKVSCDKIVRMITVTIPKKRYEEISLMAKLYRQLSRSQHDVEALMELSGETKMDLAKSLKSKKRYSLDEVKTKLGL